MSRPDQPPEKEPDRWDQNKYSVLAYVGKPKKTKLQHGLSDAQVRAMNWLYNKSGLGMSSGVLDKNGRLVADGEVLCSTEPITWLRLCLKDLLFCSNNRIYFTMDGRLWCSKWLPQIYGIHPAEEEEDE